MSMIRIDRPTIIVDNLNDIAHMGAIRAGQLIFKLAAPAALYACFDGTNLVQIDSASFNTDANGNVGLGTTAATQPIQNTTGRRYLTIIGSTKAGIIEMGTNEADGNAVVVGSQQYSDKNCTGAEKRVGAVVTQLHGAQANNRGGKVIFYTKADNGSGISNRVEILNVGGIKMANSITAAPDADLEASTVHLYLDDTNGAGKLKIKGKTADGTVVTGSVNLA